MTLIGPLSAGFTHTPGTTIITVLNAGIYNIIFSVSGVEPNQFSLFVNGAPTAVVTLQTLAGGTQINANAALLLQRVL